jgi:drug/metabolite transporter (DMT)-like permease
MLFMLGMPASWVLASQLGVHLSTTMAVFWLSPLLIIGLVAAVLGERAPLRLWIAAAIACAGALALSRPGALPPPWLLVFPAGMALTFSLYVVLTRSLRTETTRANLFYSALGVAVSLTPVMARVWVSPAPRDFAIMVAVGVLGLVCLWTLDRLAHEAPVSLSAPFAFLQVPIVLGIHWLRGHEHLGLRAALGVTLIAATATHLWTAEPQIHVQEPSS